MKAFARYFAVKLTDRHRGGAVVVALYISRSLFA
jgi:hypothetical protein